MRTKEPLYRRVNTRTHGVRHGWRGGEYRWSRHAKREDPVTRGAMRSERHGFDYTPLFRFLLSRVGGDWAAIHSEAVSRLDRPEPIFWLVALLEEDRHPVVLLGENSFFSGLCVDAENRLQLVDPGLRIEDMEPRCACCTHTLNGVPFTRRFEPAFPPPQEPPSLRS